MDYYTAIELNETDIKVAKTRVEDALKAEGFGVLTEIDIKATMKKKLDKDYKPQLILGACNPRFADKALSHEPNIGTLLPCNVTLKENQNGKIEVAAVNPLASMSAVKNLNLAPLAHEVNESMKRVIASLK